MEDSYAADYSSNYSGIYIIVMELDHLLEQQPADPLLWNGKEGALNIDIEMNPLVSILGYSQSESRDIYMALQEEEEDY